MKPPNNSGEFWGFNEEESDEDTYSFDEDEENTAGFKPILKVRKIIIGKNVIHFTYHNTE